MPCTVDSTTDAGPFKSDVQLLMATVTFGTTMPASTTTVGLMAEARQTTAVTATTTSGPVPTAKTPGATMMTTQKNTRMPTHVQEESIAVGECSLR